MAKKKSYDVFISYRREGGLDFARSIAYYLRIEGYQCFFDQRELKTGQFNEQIYEAIDNSKHFLSVLTPGALERCANKEDWVRKEIEYAIKKGVHVVPVAVRGEKLQFPENLPDSLAKLKTAQATFIDRETIFEDSIMAMLRDQMKDLTEMTSRQHRKVKSQTEKVFRKKAARFKGNDGLIDDQERAELERLASASGINRNRLEELIEEVETAAARRAEVMAWMKRHPRVVAGIGLAVAILAIWLVVGIWTRLFPSEKNDNGERVLTSSSERANGRSKDVTRDIKAAAAELEKLDASHRSDAESDFQRSLRDDGSVFVATDDIGKRIAKEYKAAIAEGRKLAALGMSSYELTKSRPDLVMRFADIRIRVEADMRELIKSNRHEDALNYYNSAKEAFRALNMSTLSRPSFSND